MQRSENPYGVGGHAVRRQCDCCYIDFISRSPLDGPRCANCRDHAPSGSTQQQVECWREHAIRYREITKRAHSMVKEAVDGKERAEKERSEAKQETSVALRRRSYWRAMYDAVMALHADGTDGHCSCGEHPCPERQAAAAADFRLHRNYLD